MFKENKKKQIKIKFILFEDKIQIWNREMKKVFISCKINELKRSCE